MLGEVYTLENTSWRNFLKQVCQKLYEYDTETSFKDAQDTELGLRRSLEIVPNEIYIEGYKDTKDTVAYIQNELEKRGISGELSVKLKNNDT